MKQGSSFKLNVFLLRTIAAQIHLFGFGCAFFGTIALVMICLRQNDTPYLVACIVYGITAMLVFGTSSIYHFLSDGFSISEERALRWENYDHFAIYLFIAGTYTPCLIRVIAPPWKQILLVLIWAIAVSGIIYTYSKPRLPAWARRRFIYTGIFILMGWTLMIRVQELFSTLTPLQALLLVAGGASYTIGALGYALKKPKLYEGVFGFHELWHVMVLIGFLFHYALIFLLTTSTLSHVN